MSVSPNSTGCVVPLKALSLTVTYAVALSAISSVYASQVTDSSGHNGNRKGLTQKSNRNKGKKTLAPPRKKANSSQSLRARRPAPGGAIPTGRTILDLQRSARHSSISLVGDAGAVWTVTLTELNPEIGAWYFMRIRFPGETTEIGFNLEMANPEKTKLSLDSKYPDALIVTEDTIATPCTLFDKEQRVQLLDSLKAQSAYTNLCNNKIFTRNKVDGRKTTKEWVAEFLRDNVWGGEEVTTFVKEKFFKDKFLLEGTAEKGKTATKAARTDEKAPRPGRVASASRDTLLPTPGLGLSIAGEDGGQKMTPGQWYELKTQDGIFVSAIEPEMIDPEILGSYKSLVNKLDTVESKALDYLVAFDLNEYQLGYTLGTDHPRIDWSRRVIEEVRDRSVQGPDGLGDWAPLVTTGMINPAVEKNIVATFTGGFKRDHGAMKWGPLAYKNRGTHYGFVENGVLFSKLNPGLATIYQTRDGAIEMRTWEESDSKLESKVVYARQNGVAIIEWDEASRNGIPGKLVRHWGPGNWSGSEDSKLRTLRAGICKVENKSRKFLVYGYFSSATPSAMARVFQAYGCSYAMHMDMNALEHTYLAVYAREGKELSVEHLINGMNVLDKQFKNLNVPRFIGFPDNRDFFYLYKRK